MVIFLRELETSRYMHRVEFLFFYIYDMQINAIDQIYIYAWQWRRCIWTVLLLLESKVYKAEWW